jgi:hypothetical protein
MASHHGYFEVHIKVFAFESKCSYENEKCGTFLHQKKHDRCFSFPSIEETLRPFAMRMQVFHH